MWDHLIQLATVIGTALSAYLAGRSASSSKQAKHTVERMHKTGNSNGLTLNKLAGQVRDIDHNMSELTDKVKEYQAETNGAIGEMVATFAAHISDGHDPIDTRHNRRVDDPHNRRSGD